MTAPAAAIATHDANGKPVRRYPIPDPDTGEVRELFNVSAIIDVLQSFGLDDWKLKMAAVGMAHRLDLQAAIAVGHLLPVGRERNAALNDTIELAIQHGQTLDPAAGYLKNDYGSSLHLLTELLDDGAVDDVLSLPSSIAEHAARYVDLIAAHGIVWTHREVTIWGGDYAGTVDGFARFPSTATVEQALFDQFDLGRGTIAVDTKTGKVKKSAALQLAALANGRTIYDAATGTHLPMPDDMRTDIGLILHLTAEKAELVPVDLDMAWPAFQGALAVKLWDETKPLHPPLAPGQAAPLADQLAASLVAVRDQENAEATDLLDAMGETPTGVPAANAYTEPAHISDTLKLAIAAIPDDPAAGTITDDGTVTPDLAARTAYLTSRLAELITNCGEQVGTAWWPDGVPTFGQARDTGTLHTADQLDAIHQALVAVERDLRAPFPLTDDLSDIATRPVPANDPRVADITARFAALPSDLKNNVAAQAEAAGVRPFSQGAGTEQCVVTWQRILHTAEIEAGQAQERANNAAGVLIEAGVDPGHLLVLVGNYTAATTWQADRLDELADAFGLEHFAIDGTRSIVITDAGRKHLETEFGGKTGVRKAARMTADQWGIEPPAKADDVYANPLLAAALCMSESEPTEISSPNPAA